VASMDANNLSFGVSGNFSFLNPTSVEFRGISELYDQVMWQLLLVFFFVICYILFMIGFVTLVIVENRKKLIDLAKQDDISKIEVLPSIYSEIINLMDKKLDTLSLGFRDNPNLFQRMYNFTLTTTF